MNNPFVTGGYAGTEYFCDRGIYSIYDKFFGLWLKRQSAEC